MILLPLLTMRLFTEEKRQKTDQCLLTAPVNLFSVVMGKFLAATCVFICAIAVYAVYAVVLFGLSGYLAWATVIGNLAALVMLGASGKSGGGGNNQLHHNNVFLYDRYAFGYRSGRMAQNCYGVAGILQQVCRVFHGTFQRAKHYFLCQHNFHI